MGFYDSNCDYNKYKIFYAVAEVNSFSKAADILHISQPAISYSIKELENQLNTSLFIRENRKIKLTEDGEKLIYYLRRAFNDINVAEKTIKEGKSEFQGTIKLGIYAHISLVIMPKLLEDFGKICPNVKFEIFSSSSEELKEKLKTRELDFIITQYPLLIENNDIFTEEILFELKNTFFTTPHYHELYINNKLHELPLILPFRGYVDIDTLDEVLKEKKLKIKNLYRIYSSDLSRKLVLSNFGIGWGPRKCIENDLDNNILCELDLGFETPNTKYSITYNENFLTNTTKEFIKFMKKETKNLE